MGAIYHTETQDKTQRHGVTTRGHRRQKATSPASVRPQAFTPGSVQCLMGLTTRRFVGGHRRFRGTSAPTGNLIPICRLWQKGKNWLSILASSPTNIHVISVTLSLHTSPRATHRPASRRPTAVTLFTLLHQAPAVCRSLSCPDVPQQSHCSHCGTRHPVCRSLSCPEQHFIFSCSLYQHFRTVLSCTP